MSATGGFQRAHDGARRCDDLAVPFAGAHPDECSQLMLEWGAPGVHGPTPGHVGGRLAPSLGLLVSCLPTRDPRNYPPSFLDSLYLLRGSKQ
jgi:hypothetical protein